MRITALLPVVPRKVMLMRKSPSESIESGSLTTIWEKSKFGTLRMSSTDQRVDAVLGIFKLDHD